jgi:hypothetical protein
MMQRYMPLIFAVIYINIAAGVNIYFIVSSLCRIGIQEAIFRSGTLNKAVPAEGVLPSRAGSAEAPRRRSMMERLADLQTQALEQKEAQKRAREALPPGERKPQAKDNPPRQATSSRPGASSNGAPKAPGKAPSKPAGNGAAKANGQGPAGNSKSTNGAETNGSGDKTTHPRSKTKRERKDR